ncbi:glycosyltransferase [Shewanella sp. YLB-07]|uniref:glycosyltransferase n=1 Tax=Shewanella sp. YLB-07 TaxID=2601268 RepID=UPI00128C5E7F|nr:glycosyltransferase [Shewanella sp. YLB-07]MPY24860.1 glycosyltransferase family 4 protein [Shewanella sp. YLB-07]
MKLIFAGNLHSGGAVQVATSFIFELVKSKNDKKLSLVDVVVSSQIDYELSRLGLDFSCFNNYVVKDYIGRKIPSDFKFSGSMYDCCFIIFGPIYYDLNSKRYIVGFAQPWIAYPKNDAYLKLNIVSRVKNLIKYAVQKRYFSSYDHLVVEHQHVKDALIAQSFKMPISVVSNSCSRVFDEPHMWEDIVFPLFNNTFPTLGFLGYPHIHKNLDVLLEVGQILEEEYNFPINFLFTLTDLQMSKLGFDKRKNYFTVGPISSTQCPIFYKKIDALIFPSLLECFSATPIEAMKMGKPIFSSNYPFVSQVCGDAAFYFNASSAKDIARVIYNNLQNYDLLNEKCVLGKKIVNDIPTAEIRSGLYWDILSK